MNASHVRGIIAILFTIGVLGGFFLDKIPAELVTGLAGSAITYYFTKTTEERATSLAIKALTTNAEKTSFPLE